METVCDIGPFKHQREGVRNACLAPSYVWLLVAVFMKTRKEKSDGEAP
jgi:hypothetical protein